MSAGVTAGSSAPSAEGADAGGISGAPRPPGLTLSHSVQTGVVGSAQAPPVP
jgi:hypothetical protein